MDAMLSSGPHDIANKSTYIVGIPFMPFLQHLYASSGHSISFGTD